MDAQKRPLSKTYSKAKMLSHSISLSSARRRLPPIVGSRRWKDWKLCKTDLSIIAWELKRGEDVICTVNPKCKSKSHFIELSKMIHPTPRLQSELLLKGLKRPTRSHWWTIGEAGQSASSSTSVKKLHQARRRANEEERGRQKTKNASGKATRRSSYHLSPAVKKLPQQARPAEDEERRQ
jgi:hypothetical protein